MTQPRTETPPAPAPDGRTTDRPDNREVENEDLRPGRDGEPPRPASEPPGSRDSSQSPKTLTDPGTGEEN